MTPIGQIVWIDGKKYEILSYEGDQVRLKCLFCGGKIITKHVSKIPA